MKLDPEYLKSLIKQALAEDVGSGDVTTLAMIPEDAMSTAHFLSKEPCVLAGLDLARLAFSELDRTVEFASNRCDGDSCAAGERFASVTGRAQALLTAERVALNYLQRLSGIATQTNRFVEALGKNSKTRILDTRKTIPGMRVLEKYAVAMGGGSNHRFGLFDQILVKDNHLALLSRYTENPIERAVREARIRYPKLLVEVEAKTMDEVEEAVRSGADVILLDNMTNDEMEEALQIIDGKARTEASGNMSLERVSQIAHLGLDFISVGALTHSVRTVDISLEFEE